MADNTIKTTATLDVTQVQQKIIKLGAVASDSTRTLEERIAAKNEQVELQNKLSKNTISSLEKEISKLKKLEGTEKEVTKLQKKLNSERVKATRIAENNEKQQRKLNLSLEKSKDAMSLFDSATGGLISKFGDFRKGLGAVAGGFRGIGGAIAASGLGLLALVITGIIQAFKNSEEGQNKFAKIMGVIGAVTGNFVDLLADLGDYIIAAFENPKEALNNFIDLIKKNIINRFEGLLELIPKLGDAISLLFDGEFSAAGKVAADAVAKVTLGVENVTDKVGKAVEKAKEFTAEQIKEGEAAARVADMRAKADKIERKLLVDRAKLENDIAQLRLKSREEENYSAEERANFLKEAQKLEDELLSREKEAAVLRADAIKIENSFARSSKENLDAQAQAEAKVFQIQSARTNSQISTQRQLNRLNREISAEEKSRRAQEEKDKDDAEARQLERNAREVDAQIELDELLLGQKKAAGENTLAAELDILERRKKQELSNKDLTESEKALIEAKYAEKSAKLTHIAEKTKTKSREEASKNAIGFAAEQFGIAKEVAVAEMIMAAPDAVGQSFKKAAAAYAPPLSGIMGAIGAATVVAPIIKGLSDIKKVRFPGKKKGKGTAATTSGSISTSTAGGSATATTSAITDISANNAARLGVDPTLGSNASATAANNVLGSTQNQVVFSEEKYNDFQNQVAFKEGKISV